MGLRVVISIVLIWLVTSGCAVAATLQLSVINDGSVLLQPYLEAASAESAAIHPEKLHFLAQNIQLIKPNDSARWFYFELENDLDNQKTVYLNIPLILFADLTLIQQTATQELRYHFGHSSPLADWPAEPGKFVVPLTLARQETSRIYFHVDSKSTMPFMPRIGSEAAIERSLHQDAIDNYLLAGFLATLIFYLLLTMIIVRDFAAYRYYLLQAVWFFVFIAYNNGWLFIGPLRQAWVYEAIYSITVPLITIFQLLFVRDFFRTKANEPRWYRVLTALIVVHFIAMLGGLALGMPTSIAIQTFVASPTITVLLLMAIIFWQRKLPSSEYFCLAYSSFFIMVAIAVLAYIGVLPYPSLMRDALQYAIALQMLLYGLAIVKQLRVYRERETATRVQAELLRKESTAKTSFLTHMSHELRTPLNGIIGMAQLLDKTELTQQQRYYSKTILKSSNVLLSLINDVLDFSKIRSGKLVLEQSPFNFMQLISDCVTVFLPDMMEKGIPVYTHIAPECPHYVVSDEYRIKQIILNLVSNALKFTDKGEVEIHLGFTPEHSDSGILTIAVRDSGIGMESATLDKVFSEFTQEDVTTTRRFGGTGLGLAIIKGIVDTMGGEISASSKKAQGSCFTVKIPVTIDVPRESVFIQMLETLKGRRILLAIKQAYIRTLIQQQLDYWQAELFFANSDAEITALLEQHTIDGIVGNIEFDEDYWQRVDYFQSLNIRTLLCYAMPPSSTEKTLPDLIDTIQFPVNMQELLEKIINLVTGTVTKPVKTDEQANIDCSDWRVLLVEDNPVNRAVSLGILSQWNIQPDIAENGAEAVRLFKQNRYPLIFMDCEMPVMDGYQATQQIRNLESVTEPSYIIALTAHNMKKEQELCLASGMNEVVSKPLTIREMKTIIEKIFSNRIGPARRTAKNGN